MTRRRASEAERLRIRALVMLGKAERLRLGYSQQYVASQANILQSQISDLEAVCDNPELSYSPTLDTFVKYMAVLGFEVTLQRTYTRSFS